MNKRKNKQIRIFFVFWDILLIIFLVLTPIFSVYADYPPTEEDLWNSGNAYSGNTSSSSTTGVGLTNSTGYSSELASANNKQQGPQATLTFSVVGAMNTGSKITATATPNGFITNTENLYFTWYLKHSSCDLASQDKFSGLSSDVKKSCDLDGDEKITVNDWKIAAVRNIIQGSFDKSEADYDAESPSKDMGGGVKADPSISEWERTIDPEEENDSSDDIPNCYVQDTKSGIIYELRKTTSEFGNCESGYHPACVQDTTVKCNVLNPSLTYRAQLENASSSTSPTLAELLLDKTVENNFSACAVISEDTSFDKITDCKIKSDDDLKNFSSYEVCKDDESAIPICVKDSDDTILYKSGTSASVDPYIYGIIFKKDKINSDPATNNTNGVCEKVAFENIYTDNFATPPSFLENTCVTPNPVTETATLSALPAATSGCSSSQSVAPEDSSVNPSNIEGLPVSVSLEKCSTLTTALVQGLNNSNSSTSTVLADGDSDLLDTFNENESTCTFKKDANLCKHLFPYFPKESVTVDEETVNLKDVKTGDGVFTMAEKEFWGADPTSDSTNGNQDDEASVMGLGVDNFTWTYTKGDKIGVVIEGKSNLATDHSDSSYRTMWAFPKGCSKLEEIGESGLSDYNRGFYVDNTTNKGIFTADFDLNDCLEENLMAPDDNGTNKIKVDLSSTPTDPINDPDGMGDRVSVTASIQNVSDLSSMYYIWKIERSESDDTYPTGETTWKDITAIMQKPEYNSLSSADQQGIGKSQVSFLLNLPESLVDPHNKGVFYLRIRATASEKNGNDGQIGTGFLIIKVIEQKNQINIYSVIADDNGYLSLNNGVGSSQLCSDTEGKKTCYVTKNQVVGLTIPNKEKDLSGFVWKVNDVTMSSCTTNMSPANCSGSDNNTFFFPVLGNEGEAINVVVSVLSQKTQSKIELIRHFVIIAPQLRIISKDTSNVWPKLLGYYKSLDSAGSCFTNPTGCTADFSNTVFETNPGKIMTFEGVAYSAWNYGQKFTWSIDGQIQDVDTSASNQIVVPVYKTIGDNYNIGLVSEMTNSVEQNRQINNMRRALLKNWSINPEEAMDEASSVDVQINVVADSNQVSANSEKTGIFASLITNLPEQIMFLLKISLTGFALIFFISLLFYFIPESIFESVETKNETENKFRL